MNIWIFSVDLVTTLLHDSDADDVDVVNVVRFFGVSDDFFVFSTTTTVQRNAR